jgi:hypothetical protein
MQGVAPSKNWFSLQLAKQFSWADTHRRWLIVILTLAFVLRAAFALIFKWNNPSGDEAVAGLMAKHIAEGRDFPVFFYGQAYFGALEPYLNGILLYLFGFRPNLIYVLPLVFSVTVVFIEYAWVKRFFGANTALESAILIAVAPVPYLRETLFASGGFCLALFLQIAAAWLYIDLYYSRTIANRKFLVFCFVSGLLFWVWQIYIPIFFILLLVWLCAPPSLSFRFLILGIMLFMVGSAPLWLYNLAYSGTTFVEVFGKFAAADSDKGLASLARGFLGNRLWNARYYLETLLSAMSAGNYLLLLPLAIGSIIALRQTSPRMFRFGQPIPAEQLVALLTIVILIVGHRASRYLMIAPLLLLPLMFMGLRQLGRWPIRIFLALAIATNLMTFWQAAQILPHQLEWSVLTDKLRQNNMHYGYSDFETAYALTFLSAEEIIVAPAVTTSYGERTDRYPAYTVAVSRAPETFLLVAPDSPDLAKIDTLDKGAAMSKRRVVNFSNFRLYYPLTSQDTLVQWLTRL